MFPAASSDTFTASSAPSPPRKVEATRPVPAGFSTVTNASGHEEAAGKQTPPRRAGGKAPGVVGKSAEYVPPTTIALPAASTATPLALSKFVPPRKVAYASVPAAEILATNASGQGTTSPATGQRGP